ncbi:MAG: FixH family protein [Campylobacterota bacterium]
MKNLFKVVVSLLFTLGVLNAQPLSEELQKGDYTVKITSSKSLTVGNNDIYVQLFKDNKAVTDAKVKSKFFMPEMPGMPYMEYKDKANLVGNKYKMTINLAMSGTWQYQLKFKTKQEKIYTLRGKVNL